MPSQSLHHFARRGMDVARAVVTTTQNPDKQVVVKISAVAGLVFFFTILAFMVFIFAFSYTYGELLPTLCAVESPETNAYVPVQTISSADEPPAYTEDDDGLPKPSEPEVLLVRSQPITSSIRATILHLRARAGFWSRFRGMGLYIIWGFLRNIAIAIVTLGSRNPLATSAAAIIAEVALAHVHMTWVHIVISEPSPKKWYQRIPSFRGNWVKIAPAVLLWSVAAQIVRILPALMVGSWGVLKHIQDPSFQPGAKHIYLTATQLFMGVVLSMAMFILLELPAAVTFIRVSASMLPEEDETIVPFDRTFGGQVTPSIIGGQGKIGLVEAWRSFPWQSRKRLLMLCLKVTAIFIAVYVFFSIILVAEAHAMIGPDGWRDIMRQIHGAPGPQ